MDGDTSSTTVTSAKTDIAFLQIVWQTTSAMKDCSMRARELLPWVLGAAFVVLGVLALLWWTAPPDNTLPDVYEVM